MQRVGSTLTKSLTLPIAAFGGAAVKAFADFDSAMTESVAIMDGVTSDVRKEMEAAAKSVSQELTTTSKEAAESYFFLASAGLDAQQSIKALPQVAKFAQAGMFDMAKATDLATDAQSALGLTVDDASQNMRNLTRVTDTLVKANTLANASVQQFSEALTNRAAAALRAANKDIEEGVAVLAAFADQGMKGQRAGEQLARILRILSQEAAKNRDLFQDLGLIDASGNLASMSDIIKVLTREMKGLSDAEKSAKLEQLGFTARVQSAIKPLLGTADAIKEYEKGLKNAGGITEQVANKQLKSLTAQFNILWNTVVNAGQAIGASISETFDIKGLVKSLQTSIQSGIEWFNSLSKQTRQVAFSMAAVLGASGPIIAALGTLSVAIGAISAPIAATAAAVGAAATLIISNWDTVSTYFTSGTGARMWGVLKAVVQSSMRVISSIVSTTVTVIKSVWADIVSYFTSGAGAEVWSTFKETAKEAINAVAGFVRASVSIIQAIWDKFGPKIIEIAQGTWDRIKTITAAAFEVLGTIVNTVLKQITNIVNIFEGIFTGNWEKVWNSVKNIFVVAINSLIDLVSTLVTKSLELLQSFVSHIPGVGDAMAESFQTGIDVVKDLGESIKMAEIEIEGASSSTTGWSFAWDSVASSAQKAAQASREAAQAQQQGAQAGGQAAGGFDQETFGAVSQAINKEQFAGWHQGFKNQWGKIKSTMQGQMIPVAKQTGNKMASSLGKVNSAGQQVGSVLGKAFDKVALKGQDILDVTGQLLKQLGSQLFTQGITALLTGGTSLAGGGLASAIFGGLFHSGGVVPGSGEKMIKAKGGEGVFTRGQMKAMGQMQSMQPRQSGGASSRDMEKAFSKALSRHTSKLDPEEVFTLSQKGKEGF